MVRFRRLVLEKLVVWTAVLAMSSHTASGASIQAMARPLKGEVTLSLIGTIRPGDDVRLTATLEAYESAGVRIIGIRLKSMGGETNTSLAIAHIVRDRKLPVYVSSICASGCAIIALAAPVRVVGKRASIAVHEAYRIGNDGQPLRAPDATAHVADRLRSYGVPERIIRKLETTPYTDITRLDRRDLAELNTTTAGTAMIR